MTSSGDAVNFSDAGQYLRESRESLAISIEEAARALHIRPKYLHCIEKGSLQDLPGNAYAYGYIKNYADYLGLDAKTVLSRYDATPAHKDQAFFVPVPSLKQHLPTRGILWSAFAGILLLYGFWYGVVYDTLSSRPEIEPLPEKFKALLGSSPPGTMAAGWQQCLTQGGPHCFMTLRTTSIPAKTGYHAYFISRFTPKNP